MFNSAKQSSRINLPFSFKYFRERTAVQNKEYMQLEASYITLPGTFFKICCIQNELLANKTYMITL